jgi:hypothetical protein
VYPQARPGDLDLASVQRYKHGIDELEQLRERRPACYIATRSRRAAILHHARRPCASEKLERAVISGVF